MKQIPPRAKHHINYLKNFRKLGIIGKDEQLYFHPIVIDMTIHEVASHGSDGRINGKMTRALQWLHTAIITSSKIQINPNQI
jgi:hypothetical protein